MNKRWKAALLPVALSLGVGLCPAFCLGLAAETATVEEKTIVFSVTEEGGQFAAEPDQPAVWEFPLVPAGQTRRAGTLRLRNDSDATVHLRLEQIELPYGDTAALTYLDALRITVTEGDQTLYDGPYSRIADADGGLKLETASWAPGATRELSIALRCPCSYEGNPAEVSKEITWVFSASAPGDQINSLDTSKVQPPADDKLDITTIVILSGAGLLLLVCIGAGVVSFVRKRR